MTLSRLTLLLAALSLPACAHRRGAQQVQATQTTLGHHSQAWSLLESSAGDLDEAVRAEALGALVLASTEPAGGPWAPRGLYDPSPWVQRAAVDALAARPADPAAVDLLSATAARPDLDPYVRCAAGAALRGRAPEGLLATVQAAEEQAGAPWKAAPCALAAAQLGDEAAIARLGAILREGDLPLDIRFLDDVGRSGFAALVEPLTEAAELVEDALLPAVGAALLRLGSPRGEAVLKSGLSARAPQAQLESLDFLSGIQNAESTAALRRAAASTTGVAHTYAQLILVGRGEASLGVATEAAGSSNREIRAMALRHLGRAVGHARLTAADAKPTRKLERAALELFSQGATDFDDPVREAAAEALGALPRDAATTPLEGLLQDENARVQVAAAVSLLRVGR